MKVHFFTSFFAITSIISPSSTYRILGVFSHMGRSHFNMYEQLSKGLAKRGHQVDVVSHFPLKTPFPNYNQIIDWAGTASALQNNLTYEFVNKFKSLSPVPQIAVTYGGDRCDLMNQLRFKELINNPPTDPSYDILIVDIFGATCYLALGQHLNVPVVGVVSSSMWPWANSMVANPDNPAYTPSVFSGLGGEMYFWERVTNTLQIIKEKWEFDYYSAYQDEKIQKYIGPHAPSLREAERNVSLILVNSHHSLHGARPYTTAVVEVGGLHISENPESLPNDLEKWLNDSKDGFVYISFGAMVRIESFPMKSLNALYTSFAKLSPVRVLMKIANPKELPPGLPNNVLTRPWISQLAVLRHKNVRAFMTHGGLMGTQEAVHCGVPMIGIPLMLDQFRNIQIYVEKHVAVLLEADQLTEEKLDDAFNTVLNDPSYMLAVKKLSSEFRDRPMSALDTAVFWVEYVVRNGGANLRSRAMDLTWWQIALLDVYATLLLAFISTIYLSIFIIIELVKWIRRSSAKMVESKKHE